ncbi:helix-turn-helix domain-containing protein [Chromobacterium violaceum]|uniref:helix-turn-helix domain-containing protein n=1 Tax=Chromobacterium violaceum TaxID=536 RepID=UPI001E2BB3DD|nr:helix-turn-helix domain-containing protein [Chromobacterium violaceum]MCD0493827.1 helix-turn-helix domain-containing protein [Chromobacterium violaceum]
MDESTMDIGQAAMFLHCCEDTVYQLARKKKLPGRKVGRGWVFLKSDLVAHIRGGQNGSRQEAQVGIEEKGVDVCRSISAVGLGGAISQRQAVIELDNLLGRVSGKKRRNSTIS